MPRSRFPGATGCPIDCSTGKKDIINQQMKIPSPSGQNLASIGSDDSGVRQGIVACIDHAGSDVGSGLDLSFDAGTRVAKGPATHLWTFPDPGPQSKG